VAGQVLGDERVQRRNPDQPLGQPLGQPATGQPPAGVVLDLDVVMGLGPVVAHEQQQRLPLCRLARALEEVLQRANGSVLDGTTSHQSSRPPHRPDGHDLAVDLTCGLRLTVLTAWRLGHRACPKA